MLDRVKSMDHPETSEGDATPKDDQVTKEPAQAGNPSSQNNELSTTLRNVTDQVLNFLSSASNETLGACVVGLGATTYIALGRIGLVLIGAFGGIVLQATWEGKANNDVEGGSEQKRRREAGIDVARRVLDWRSSRTQRPIVDDIEHDDVPATDFASFGPEVASSLNILTDAVIGDYVKWWYSPILPSEQAFPAVSRATFSSFLLSLSSHISRKRPADTFVEFVTNSSSICIVFLNELSIALMASPSTEPEAAIQTYLQSKPESNLANITDPEQQSRKLLGVADDILDTYSDPKVYACPPARVFLREILAKVVLGMTLDRCSQADWINEWIVYLLEEGEPELLTAIDAGVENSGAKTTVDGRKATNGHANEEINSNPPASEHKRNKSRAEDAMEDAMREAQRLTELIAEEEARRQIEPGSNGAASDDASDSTNTQGVQTPSSSQDDATTEQPVMEVSEIETSTGASSSTSAPFTSFDQIMPQNVPTALLGDNTPIQFRRQENLTLHKARVTIYDDAEPGDKKALKGKPTSEYMIQIEPASSSVPGWMIARVYADFEPLHEVLRRISTIAGTTGFTQAHSDMPAWRGRTMTQLTQHLERYLMDALSFEPLAESEGMKRFLEKERNMTNKTPRAKSAFWAGPTAIENMGKGVFDVLSKAPKNVAGGGKAVLGGVTGVFGAIGGQPARTATSPVIPSHETPMSNSNRQASVHVTKQSTSTLSSQAKQSLDYPRTPAEASPQSDSRPSSTFGRSQSSLDIDDNRLSSNGLAQSGTPTSRVPQTPPMNLPPPPSEIPDDFKFPARLDTDASTGSAAMKSRESAAASTAATSSSTRGRQKAPMTEKEIQVTVELLFAVINELYTLSSAWTLRRTLLNAARTYLLRPGNPQLESIRVLLQESVLDSNTSDFGIAAQVLKIRENALPTEEELKKWPAPRSDAEKEKMRIKARKLLISKGMPQALTSVMGQAASGEALAKVFDSLQIEKVAKGLIFGLMMQAIRALTQ